MEEISVKKSGCSWLGVALVVAAVAIRFIKPVADWSQRSPTPGWRHHDMPSVSWRDIGARSAAATSMRTMAFGGVLMFIVLLVGLCLGVRHSKIWDLTSSRHSRCPIRRRRSQDQAAADHPVFPTRAIPAAIGKSLQDQLSLCDTPRSRCPCIDAVKDPVRSKQFDIRSVPTTVFGTAARPNATGAGPSRLHNALKKLLEARRKGLLRGGQRHDMEGTDQRGYAQAVSALKEDNFESARLVIPLEGKSRRRQLLIINGQNRYTGLDRRHRVYLGRGGASADARSAGLTNDRAREGLNIGRINIIIDISGRAARSAGRRCPSGCQPVPPIAERRKLQCLHLHGRPPSGGPAGFSKQAKSWAESTSRICSIPKTSPGAPARSGQGDIAGPVSVTSASRPQQPTRRGSARRAPTETRSSSPATATT